MTPLSSHLPHRRPVPCFQLALGSLEKSTPSEESCIRPHRLACPPPVCVPGTPPARLSPQTKQLRSEAQAPARQIETAIRPLCPPLITASPYPSDRTAPGSQRLLIHTDRAGGYRAGASRTGQCAKATGNGGAIGGQGGARVFPPLSFLRRRPPRPAGGRASFQKLPGRRQAELLKRKWTWQGNVNK